MLITLTPTVATWCAAFFTGTNVIPHVIGEHTILNEHVALACMTFVVNTNSAPFARHCAVVYQRDKRRRHKFAHAVCIHTGATRNKVCFQTMATCFVKQHATRTTLDNNWHSAAWGRTSTQLAHCLTCSTFCQLGNAFFFEQFKTNGVTQRVVSRLHAAVAIGHCAHSENCAHLFIGGKHAIGVSNQNAPCAIAVTSTHLHNASVNATSNIVGNTEQFNLARLRHCLWRNAHVVHLLALHGSERHCVGVAIASTCCGCGCFSSCH